MKIHKAHKTLLVHAQRFAKRLSPYRVRANDLSFLVHYQPFWETVNSGEWEPKTFAIFDRFLDAGHSFIDIGAWIGPTTLYGSQIAKRCHAVEPDPVAFEQLEKNVALNKTFKEKIRLHHCCISDKDGTPTMGSRFDMGDSMTSLMFANSQQTFQVKALSLDTFLKENNIDDCNFIKMDIEGGESLVLPNFRSYIEKQRPTLHLSLHPHFFEDPIKDGEAVYETIALYRHIYDNHGNALSLKTVYADYISRMAPADLVLSDRPWHN